MQVIFFSIYNIAYYYI